MFKPRSFQESILLYSGGRMGVAAVPGSGKTHTLSYLAAKLLAEGLVEEDQEVLIVTLVNSAVDNFSSRIADFTRSLNLLPGWGYRVRTLHGLAHDILRDRPELVGLNEQFQIIDERESNEILRDTSQAWMKGHSATIELFTDPDLEPNRQRFALQKWEDLLASFAGSFIRQSKDLQASPAEIRRLLDELPEPQPLLDLGWEIYADYQRALNYRSAVDFDDLIRFALQAIGNDPGFLARLRRKWPFILEDEAQDSSRLQENVLRLLSGPNGNWVRVGDPNQAIFETFTTASPSFLRSFLAEEGVTPRELPNSGRSTLSIINLANQLIEWTNIQDSLHEVQGALTKPLIRPTEVNDPQPNPPDQPEKVFLSSTSYSPEKEIEDVVKSIKKWLPEHQSETAAVLVPRNDRGAEVVEALRRASVDTVELLRSSHSTRKTAAILGRVLFALAEPNSTPRLVGVFQDFTSGASDSESRNERELWSKQLRNCSNLEDFVSPNAGSDWLEKLVMETGLSPDLVSAFRDKLITWQEAVLLPISELMLTIATSLFIAPTDLALAYKLSLLLERLAKNHPDWDLPQFASELEAISRNQRKFSGFGDEETGFNPDAHRGKVVVATIHKAKGLEWDRVHLLSVNNYDFPFAQPYDNYIGEKWFIRGRLNLEAEALSKLKSLITRDPVGLYAEDGTATQIARISYAEERLRLFFVGITRARKELIVTWNTGRRGDCKPAIPFVALREFCERFIHAAAI